MGLTFGGSRCRNGDAAAVHIANVLDDREWRRVGIPRDSILLSPGTFIAADADRIWGVFQVVLCGVRALLRRELAGRPGIGHHLYAAGGIVLEVDEFRARYSLFAVILRIFFVVLLRMGLVPAMVAVFAVNVIIPISSIFRAWCNPVAAVNLAILAGIAIYGFVRSQSCAPVRQPFGAG